MDYKNAWLILLLGISLITLIDTAGAVASRRFNFKYGKLSALSFCVYTTTGFLASRYYGFDQALLINAVSGVYDATLGLWLSVRLRANFELPPGQQLKLFSLKTVMAMVGVAGIFAVLGYILAKF